VVCEAAASVPEAAVEARLLREARPRGGRAAADVDDERALYVEVGQLARRGDDWLDEGDVVEDEGEDALVLPALNDVARRGARARVEELQRRRRVDVAHVPAPESQ